jgi:hypothetical protein
VASSGGVALAVIAAVAVSLNVFGESEKPSNVAADQTSKAPAADTLPPDERCTEQIMSNPRWVCLTSAIVADGKLTIDYRGDGSELSVHGGHHLHVYGGDGTNPPAAVMGGQAPKSEQGEWYVEDGRPAVVPLTDQRYVRAIGSAPKVCARIAAANHELVPDEDGAFATGNCVPITRTESTATPETAQPPRRNDPPRQTNVPTTTTEPTTTTTETTPPTPDDEAPTDVVATTQAP